MAAIDPDVEELLTSLLASPIGHLARAAIDAIVEDQPGDFSDLIALRGSGLGTEFPDDPKFERGSRYGQLEVAHRVISGRIKR